MSLNLGTFQCDRCGFQHTKSGLGLPEGWAYVIIKRRGEDEMQCDVCPTCLRAIEAEFATVTRKT